ncbi:TetR/AcrR family transcriptional regulator [Streptomyces sp. NPDC058953]|uniref:TetR/AcrR family transcriptional regulator n=1 Tax=unclassified Streptomyces TaxID=2593676 RepID=UPI003695A3CF
MARRYDPDRRLRIIDAAIRVVGRDGIAGVSHRSVAAEADVPLGSTTYHFASLDELLIAALRRSNEGFAAAVRNSPAVTDPGSDLPAGLARVLGRWFAGERADAELCYELYLAALRRPALRPVAGEWVEEVVTTLAHRVDRDTARAIAALVDGVSVQVLSTGRAYDESYVREMLRRVIG